MSYLSGAPSVDAPHASKSVALEIPGLRLFLDVVSSDLLRRLEDSVERWLTAGRNGRLPGRTYSAPPAIFAGRNQSREMIQFGVFTHSNRIELAADVLPLPPVLCELRDALVARDVFGELEPPTTCVVNVYSKGCWLPPHVDNPAFSRPFATVSIGSAQRILFAPPGCMRERDRQSVDALDETVAGDGPPNGGKKIGVPAPWTGTGDFVGERLAVELPVGSCLRLAGEAADSFEHALPFMTERRVSFTFRRLSPEYDERLREVQREKQRLRQDKIARKRAQKIEKRERSKRRRIAAGSSASPGTAQDAAPEKSGASATASATLNKTFKKSIPLPEALAPATTNAARDLERRGVRMVYDAVAQQWDGTRYKAWPRVVEWIGKQPRGSFIADMGCGNGKLLPCILDAGHVAIGLDFSIELAKIAATQSRRHDASSSLPQRSAENPKLCASTSRTDPLPAREPRQERHEVICGDLLDLPVRAKGVFDAAVCIAVMHHISTEERRKQVIKEIMSCLRVGGSCLLYAWAQEQEDPCAVRDDAADKGVSGHIFGANDVLVPFRDTRKAPAASPGKGMRHHAPLEIKDFSDKWSDATSDARTLARYCHVYSKGELEQLIEELGEWIAIANTYWDTGNWAYELRRIR